MGAYIQVFTTTSTKKSAETISDVLLDTHLAACVQVVGPIASAYWWKGKKVREKEWLCIIKTSREKYPKVERAIKKVHPYKIPEIVSMPVLAGNPDYLKWLGDSLG